MYEVICDSCGVVTSVPFKPRGHLPVYCRGCYSNQR
ncbi:MAG: CxxC-x17-CxxC domain-containing protein [Ardenticatenaceae bacterium]